MHVCVCSCVRRQSLEDKQALFLRRPSSVTLNLLTGLDQVASQPPKSACLCLPTVGDNRSPPPALTLFGLICVCVFLHLFLLWGTRVEVRELAQVVPLLAPCGFWGLIGLSWSGLKASAFT